MKIRVKKKNEETYNQKRRDMQERKDIVRRRQIAVHQAEGAKQIKRRDSTWYTPVHKLWLNRGHSKLPHRMRIRPYRTLGPIEKPF